jgi:hypothetical protein
MGLCPIPLHPWIPTVVATFTNRSQTVVGSKREVSVHHYGYTGSLKDVEYDHLVPLELGGDPNDPRNLWIGPEGAYYAQRRRPAAG